MPPVELREPKRILVVVDDDASALVHDLRQRGFLARAADNSSQALRAIDQHATDLVLFDLDLVRDGELDRLLRARRRGDDTDLVLAASDTAVGAAREAVREGASDYLTKPLELDELELVLDRTLERRRLIRENEAYRLGLRQEEARRERQLEESSENTLQALVSALDLRDNETYGHSWRVAEYAVLVARRAGLEGPELEAVRWGAILHDVGKIGIRDAILRKRGTLTEEERSEMRKHPEMGYGMLQHMSSAKAGLDIVLFHHERWDGSGYPQGLKGEDIPIGARIFAVVDTLDAITSDRPYRPAMPLSKAREELQKHAGTQFDPAIAEIVLGIEDRIWNETRDRIDRQVRQRVARSRPET